MARYSDTINDDYGRPVQGAEVYVTRTVDQAIAALTADNGATLSQPLVTDQFGIFTFNAPDGLYDFQIRYGGRKRLSRGGVAVGNADALYRGPAGGSGPAGDVARAATRVALKAIAGQSDGTTRFLSEAGREGTFIWNATVPIVTHQADPNEGVYVAPNPAAVGAWVRQFTKLNVKWFGAVGDNVTNDGPAFLAALAFIRTTATFFGGYSAAGVSLFIPRGRYFLGTNTLDFTDMSCVVEGEGVGVASGAVSMLRWSAGATGIRTQTGKTTGADGTRTDTFLGGRCLFRGLFLRGGYVHGTTAEGEFHGFHLRDTSAIEHCYVSKFQGDGIYIVADVAAGSNANCVSVSTCFIEECRNGAFLTGGDANACTFHHVNVSSNRQWGI